MGSSLPQLNRDSAADFITRISERDIVREWRGGGEVKRERGEREMARGECSYKRTTLVVCSVNIVVAVYVLHSIYASVYTYSIADTYTSKSFWNSLFFHEISWLPFVVLNFVNF